MAFKVNWDNGAEACGTFPNDFDTETEAQEWADNWANERNLEDLGLTPEDVDELGGAGCYTAEVIEVEDEPDNEGNGWSEMDELRQAGLNRGRP